MQNSVPEVQRNRFNLQDSCQYILQGTWPENGKPEKRQLLKKKRRTRDTIFHMKNYWNFFFKNNT